MSRIASKKFPFPSALAADRRKYRGVPKSDGFWCPSAALLYCDCFGERNFLLSGRISLAEVGVGPSGKKSEYFCPRPIERGRHNPLLISTDGSKATSYSLHTVMDAITKGYILAPQQPSAECPTEAGDSASGERD